MLEFINAAGPWILLGITLLLGLTLGNESLRNARTKLGAILVASLVATFVLGGALTLGIPTAAHAQSAEGAQDKETLTTTLLGNDILWAGKDLHFDNKTASNDILAAGLNINVTNTEVVGSIRAAGNEVTVDGCTVKQSITLAGNNVTLKDTTAKGAALAGSKVSFSGACNSLFAAGDKVEIDGIVKGNVHVSGDRVIVGPNTIVEGTLFIDAAEKPTIDEAAQCADVSVKLHRSTEGSLWTQGTRTLANVMGSIMGVVWGILTVVLVALLAEWLFRKRTQDAARLIKERTTPTILSGIVGAFAAPFALIVLCCLILTLPLAGATALMLVAITLVGVGFMAAALSKLAFPKLGRYKAMFAMSIILGAAAQLPIIGGLVTVAGFMFTLGYLLQKFFLSNRKMPTESGPASPAQSITQA